LAVGLLVSGQPAASADPSVASAQAQATRLSAQVQALQLQAEVAAEHFDGVQEQLGEVVSRYLTASQDVGTLSQQSAELQQQKVQRIRALYMAGGQLGLYAQVLDGTDINDVLYRLAAIGHVLDAETAAVTGADTAVARASADAAALDQLAQQRTSLQSQAALARAQVLGLLQEATAQLGSANDVVRQLVAAEQARADAAAVAAAAAALNTAATAPLTLPPGTPAQVVTAINAARTRLGDPYVWGATGPSTFDCSGLTDWAYAQAGVHLPRTAAEQWTTGPHPTLDQLQPGDLLFWATDVADPATIHHVALYIGGGYMIEAPHTGAVVHVTAVYLDGYIGATRPPLTAG
jgi:cell wall-associated NlpC family hydrolase